MKPSATFFLQEGWRGRREWIKNTGRQCHRGGKEGATPGPRPKAGSYGLLRFSVLEGEQDEGSGEEYKWAGGPLQGEEGAEVEELAVRGQTTEGRACLARKCHFMSDTTRTINGSQV